MCIRDRPRAVPSPTPAPGAKPRAGSTALGHPEPALGVPDHQESSCPNPCRPVFREAVLLGPEAVLLGSLRRNVLMKAKTLVSIRSASGLFGVRSAPVSYTHLRAHETVLDLVCRLLL